MSKNVEFDEDMDMEEVEYLEFDTESTSQNTNIVSMIAEDYSPSVSNTAEVAQKKTEVITPKTTPRSRFLTFLFSTCVHINLYNLQAENIRD